DPATELTADLRVTGYTSHGATHYPIALGIVPGEELYLRLDYRDDLFDEATVAAYAARLQRLLEAVVADPDQPVGRIDLLDERERHELLVEWNDTTHPVEPVTLPDLFERQVTASPEAVAVVCGEQRVSYRQLDGRVNQLARSLVEAGVGPESVVALALPRSVELVTAVLAVMTAGGAYL
ncbi:AMP-binding protein, partial [Rugosimonospora africana]|uniref:AMP-binding protein n=1 Tax=Rugosimonospora africana TaxID=556532 RepID=UPI0019419A47